MEHLVKNSLAIKDAATGETEGSRRVIQTTLELDQLAEEILHASSEQKIGGDGVLKALELLQEFADKNRESVDNLNSRISEFKVSSTAPPCGDEDRPVRAALCRHLRPTAFRITSTTEFLKAEVRHNIFGRPQDLSSFGRPKGFPSVTDLIIFCAEGARLQR
jgi:hypothetical protein